MKRSCEEWARAHYEILGDEGGDAACFIGHGMERCNLCAVLNAVSERIEKAEEELDRKREIWRAEKQAWIGCTERAELKVDALVAAICACGGPCLTGLIEAIKKARDE